MKISEVRDILEAEVLCDGLSLDTELHTACGSDMMSDVLAFVKEQGVLLTGLMNSQVVRTAEMMDILCIVFVRGKRPSVDIIDLAHEREIAVLTTRHSMFAACGRLYEKGLEGGHLAHE